MKKADFLVIEPKTEFIISMATQTGKVLAKVKWNGVGGPENQLMNTWEIGTVQKTDGKQIIPFESDSELDSLKKEIDSFIEECDVQINNFMQYKETKNGSKKTITAVDEFLDDKMYEKGLYNQDLEDQVDTIFGAQVESTESIDANTEYKKATAGNGWAYLDCTDGMTKVSYTILRAFKVAIDNEDYLSDSIAQKLTSGISSSELSELAVDALSIYEFEPETPEAEIKEYVNKNVILQGNEPVLENEDLNRVTVKVTFNDGSYLVTGINGGLDVATQYYVGNQFNLGSVEDKMRTAVSVELVDSEPMFESFDSILEAIRFSSKNRESTNSITGTDYSKAFTAIHQNVDRIEQKVDTLYRASKTPENEQIVTNMIPLIDGIIESYMTEFAELESKHINQSYIPVIANSISTIINEWIASAEFLDVSLYQTKSLNVKGSEIIGNFINDVYHPMTKYSDMISEMLKSGNATVSDKGISAKIKAIIDRIHNEMKQFFGKYREMTKQRINVLKNKELATA